MSLRILVIIFLTCSLLICTEQKSYTYMLAPAGDSATPGRTINNAFERTIALDYAQALQACLREQSPSLNIFITRGTGDIVKPLQNAQFANRLHVDGYISLHFYAQRTSTPSLSIFYYTIDTMHTRLSIAPTLSFIPYYDTYHSTFTTSKALASSLEHYLKTNMHSFGIITCQGIPFKPLLGVQAPAIGIEIGLSDSEQWRSCVMPLATALLLWAEQKK